MIKHVIYVLWGLLVLVIIGAIFAFTAIAQGWIGYMPPIEELQNPISKYASQVISADGQQLGTYSFSRENRIISPYSELSPWLTKALVATEDERFFSHSGIDTKAVLRAVIKRGIMGNENAGGGSTITQQLAKQLFSEKAATTTERLMQKPIEWVIAVKLEKFYTKEEIIALYINYFDFLHNAVGIRTAAATYFSKSPSELSCTEAAVLIGMCKNPAYFNPVRYPQRCLERRNVVLEQMYKAGYLSRGECNEMKDTPLELNFRRPDHKEGTATYFREYLRRILMAKEPVRSDYHEWQMQQYYEDSIAWHTDPLYGWCNKNRKKNGEPYNIYTDGLKIHTTIDSRMQKYAEEAVYEHVAKSLQPAFFKEIRGKKNAPYTSALTDAQVKAILKKSMRQSDRYRNMQAAGCSEAEIVKAFNTPQEMTIFTYHGEVDTVMTPLDSIIYYKKFLRAGFVCMDVKTGAVKAYVGGLNYAHFQYDMAGLGRRQVGSTIKPFLYSLAMENGFSPCDLAPNVQQTYIVAGQPWTPRNSSRSRYGEMVTLRWGLSQSNNWISAYLMSKLSPDAFVRLLREYGIQTRYIHPSMSLCLGPCEISVKEMVSAYTAFANHGIRSSAMFVTRIEDSEGNVVANFQPQVQEVINATSSYKMIEMLKAVIDEGTGRRIRFRYKIDAEMGGKTGTTNRNSDGWFMGFTPSLIAGCWVGGEDRDIHFDSMTFGQGASMALPIWGIFMNKVFADKSLGYSQSEKFDIPAGFNPCGNVSDEEQIDDGAIDIDEIYE
ncbi:MAG: transglycosylase domain-containing protein [Bacteroidaceae bacterium]|nr:transglycosylase domain-containing protein [Bacteroidaceae bacterium]